MSEEIRAIGYKTVHWTWTLNLPSKKITWFSNRDYDHSAPFQPEYVAAKMKWNGPLGFLFGSKIVAVKNPIWRKEFKEAEGTFLTALAEKSPEGAGE